MFSEFFLRSPSWRSCLCSSRSSRLKVSEIVELICLCPGGRLEPGMKAVMKPYRMGIKAARLCSFACLSDS